MDLLSAITRQRIGAIDWAPQLASDRRRSRVLLMKEFLRRSARWALLLDCPGRWPFFDLSSCYLDGAALPDLEPLRLPPSLSSLIRATLQWMLRDAARRERLKDASSNIALVRSRIEITTPLPPLYEPLLRFYERGGGFRKEAGFVDVDGAGIVVREIEKFAALDALCGNANQETDSLSDHELDALDSVKL